jgi:hypothetical protein
LQSGREALVHVSASVLLQIALSECGLVTWTESNERCPIFWLHTRFTVYTEVTVNVFGLTCSTPEEHFRFRNEGYVFLRG